MLLPAKQFMQTVGEAVPCRPSQIKEVLVEIVLSPISRYLHTLYCSDPGLVPEVWKPIMQVSFPD
ncbi:hypothetical protein D3C81_2289730 [compost metagenome]